MSKIKRIKFRRSDFKRAILTDTLPYEVPLLFSNDGYYDRISNGIQEKIKDVSKINFFDGDTATIAYTYRIKKDELSSRALSVMHPAIQVKIAEFYKTHSKLIIGLCNKSSFSLRRPYRVASHFYEKNRASKYIIEKEIAESANDSQDTQQKNSSSFFTYKDYVLIHRFYESTEFHELEKQYKFLRTLDISKCFPHIYTHSISWAVRSKDFAKDNRRAETFDARFDEIMRYSNHDETNGIIVGPETSRIFAEIILQGVDNNIQDGLASSQLVHGRDYGIRRYVDDYFIFSNSKSMLDVIEKRAMEELERYKLYLNEAKTETTSRPFITGQTSAKLEIANIIDEFFSKHTYSRKEIKEKQDAVEHDEAISAAAICTPITSTTTPPVVALSEVLLAAAPAAIAARAAATPVSGGGNVAAPAVTLSASTAVASPSDADDEENEKLTDGSAFPIRYIGNFTVLSATYIRRIKSVVSANGSSFDHTSNYFFSIIRKGTLGLLDRIDASTATAKENERCTRLIKAILEIIFFVFSMSPKVRTSYQICQICLALSKFARTLSPEPQENLLGSIAIHLRSAIFNFTVADEGENVEMLNLLILLHSFGNKYSLSPDELCDFFGVSLDRKTSELVLKKDFRYFQIVSFIYYMDDNEKYKNIKSSLQKYIFDLINSAPSLKSLTLSSDFTMLIFDYLRCPYISRSTKTELAKSILRRAGDVDLNARCETFLDAIDEGDWFFAWKSKDLLGAVLWKKELRPAY